MADELDVVDIEGDECDGRVGDLSSAEILQDQYLQSAWKTNSSILPWTLDSSISDENRQAIESMLLEEQYYFASKKAPKVAWTNEKTKVKKTLVKSSGAQTRWVEEEKDLFEKGLAQFGHRWTKIAKLIGTRSVLQVKSYAKQYFKNKSKTDTPAEVPSSNVTSDASIQPHISALTNAVRIEQLSDDEDVDITDDVSDDGLQSENQPEPPGSPECNRKELSPMPHPSDILLNPLSESGSTAVDGPTDPDAGITHIGIDPEPKEESGTHFSKSGSPGKHSLSEEESTESTDKTESGECPEEEVEEDQEEEEEEELRAPEQEVVLDLNTITDEEKHAIPEFFEGRPSKTPERYLKIRNYILDQWGRSRPKYLNKTSVRPGLKNCGDVNCIGRIHTYLELIGAINFNCDQAIYNRPRLVDRSRLKENKDSLETYHLAQRLQSVRTRKRRIRDMWGNWRDAKDLEGQTYEHLSAEELAIKREEMKKKGPKPSKLPKQRGSFDPFQLIPCKAFGEETEEPFRVIVCAEALIVMDIHAHVSMGEVIGLLGGTYEEEKKVLKICAAEPCNSLSTGLQCEMDPVSQTQASELLGAKGQSVVGWYHSHPAFDPNPSLRDIDTQAKYQSYFSRGGAPFIGMIVSPYNSNNPSPLSQTTCLLVQEETGPSGPQRFPYRFNIQYSSELLDWSEVMRRAEWVVFKYRLSHGSVPMDRLFRRDSSLTCLEKMLTSIQKILEQVSEIDIETFLVQIETLFNTHFLPETGSSSSHLHETVTQPQLLSFISSEPINSSQATNESDSPDELYTTRPVNHVKSCNEEEDAPVTQAISTETV
ncbi:histone H2A deubiquitinase MYSM1 [Sinocyclocheilus grahami]|uniref:Myb-like, SWIRM and MPN domain-containing protein 1 n=1 Tax=Sinocyclocheilus grahami TaxID=75366 RepID=A0A672PXA5_SINGR|nr:PREDICTED: histone H2A deubiquitinase MYSM1-like [Sinocyclocheilus grahami]